MVEKPKERKKRAYMKKPVLIEDPIPPTEEPIWETTLPPQPIEEPVPIKADPLLKEGEEYVEINGKRYVQWKCPDGCTYLR